MDRQGKNGAEFGQNNETESFFDTHNSSCSLAKFIKFLSLISSNHVIHRSLWDDSTAYHHGLGVQLTQSGL